MAIVRSNVVLADDSSSTGKKIGAFEYDAGAETWLHHGVVLIDPDRTNATPARVTSFTPEGGTPGLAVYLPPDAGDYPLPGTTNYRLKELGKKLDCVATEKTLRQLLPQKPNNRPKGTLLHRS